MSNEQTNPIPPPPEPPAPGVAPEAMNQPAQPYPGYPPYQQMYSPGAWPGQPIQYIQMAPAPKGPSPLTDPRTLTDKLPLIALIVAGGFVANGLYLLIRGFIGAPYGSRTYYAFAGVFGFVIQCVIGLALFAAIMVTKHIIDLKHAELEPIEEQ